MTHRNPGTFVIDVRTPWLTSPTPGGYPRLIHDRRTGVQSLVRSEAEIRAVIAAHGGAPTHLGLGDAIRAITKKLGFGECTPCAKRQAALNAAVPRLLRRR